jgi:general secretion pathway protein C
MADKAGFSFALPKVGGLQFGLRVVTVVLLILLADALARLSWRILADPVKFSQPLTSPQTAGDAAVSMFDVGQIRDAQLFGHGAVPSSVPAQHVNAPATKLDLVLRGIMFAEIPENSRAILSTTKGTHRAYGLEAQVPGGATLEAMYADRILLRRGGALETLFLSERQDSAIQTGIAPRGAPRFSVDNRNNLSIQRTLTQLRRDVLMDPGTLQQKLRIQPVGSGENFEGFRVFPGPAGPTLLNQLGLQPGDTITRVNNIFLDQPINGMQAMQDIADATEVTIGVVRQGNLMAIRFKFSE